MDDIRVYASNQSILNSESVVWKVVGFVTCNCYLYIVRVAAFRKEAIYGGKYPHCTPHCFNPVDGARLVLCSQTRTIAKLSLSLTKGKFRFKPCHLHLYYVPQNLRSTRVFCHCVGSQTPTVVGMAKYNEAFSRRIAMAGLKPQNRIALGVSGGLDSMALCVLAANWKTEGLCGSGDSG